MEIYVDITFYKDVYKGKTIPDISFDEMVAEASRYIYKITDKKAINDDTDIKMATCEVAEVIYKQQQEDNIKVISSETLGPRSVSFKTKAIKTDEEKETDKYKAVASWLSKSPKNYLFRGAKKC